MPYLVAAGNCGAICRDHMLDCRRWDHRIKTPALCWSESILPMASSAAISTVIWLFITALPSGAGGGPADDLPKAKWMLADRGYDGEWFRDALEQKGITPCIPGRKSRSFPVKYDKRRYKRRNRIEIMFGRLKDWRRVATRYDRCPTVFFSALALAATVLFWL
jgi:transposase